jgi:hypothetical protein
MTDYYSPTVIQQAIPDSDMTPMEQLLLSKIFEKVPATGGTYFESWNGPCDLIWVQTSEIHEALEASRGIDSQIFDYVEERLRKARGHGEETEFELDMSGTSWEFLLQDIVRRSATLRYLSVTTAFTCSKMRVDGFGGMALFITDERIKAFSTIEFLTECLSEIASRDVRG